MTVSKAPVRDEKKKKRDEKKKEKTARKNRQEITGFLVDSEKYIIKNRALPKETKRKIIKNVENNVSTARSSYIEELVAAIDHPNKRQPINPPNDVVLAEQAMHIEDLTTKLEVQEETAIEFENKIKILKAIITKNRKQKVALHQLVSWWKATYNTAIMKSNPFAKSQIEALEKDIRSLKQRIATATNQADPPTPPSCQPPKKQKKKTAQFLEGRRRRNFFRNQRKWGYQPLPY